MRNPPGPFPAFVLCVLSVLPLACSKAPARPFQARCDLDPDLLNFGNILPPVRSGDEEEVLLRFLITNRAPTRSSAGALSLSGTVEIAPDFGVPVPPEMRMEPEGDDPHFELPPEGTIAYNVVLAVRNETTPGDYTGTVGLGDTCDDLPFRFRVEERKEPSPVSVAVWESPPDGEPFLQPSGVALDPDGNVVVLDAGRGRMWKFDPDGNTLWTRAGWDEEDAEGFTTFSGPWGLAVGNDGRVYVADTEPENGRRRVTVFDPEGQFLLRFGPNRNGSLFDLAWHLEVDSEGIVYVVDQGASRVYRIELTDRYPYFEALGSFGTEGRGSGQFLVPYGLALAPDGSVLVTDLSDRVQRFNREGKYQSRWGTTGRGAGEFDRPAGITVDDGGTVYVVDRRNDRVQIFDPEGAFLTDFGLSGSDPGELLDPTDVAVAEDGRIYVTEAGNGRVQVFQRVGVGEQGKLLRARGT